MSTYWREKLEQKFIQIEKKLSLDEILQKARDAYLCCLPIP